VKTEGGASVAKIPVIAVADCTVATRLTREIVKSGEGLRAVNLVKHQLL
jgi:hypothetical protein